jgi:ABC-type uncharacterized transport system permease subunit
VSPGSERSSATNPARTAGWSSTTSTRITLTTALLLSLAVVGGLIWPVEILPDVVAALARGLPTYWLGELGRAPVSDEAEPAAVGLAVVAAWTALFAMFAAWRFRSAASRPADAAVQEHRPPNRAVGESWRDS